MRRNSMGIPKAIFCWSGGKDSSYALHKVRCEKQFEIKYLLTTVNKKFRRISMHGVREELLHLQSESVGIPLQKVFVNDATNAEYEQQMERTLLKAKEEGIEHVIFGDIFLEDLRIYREENLAKVGMKGVFPLWKVNTKWMINDFLAKGFKTITCCVSDGQLSQEWVGKEMDQWFIDNLPPTVDPCGENGEFHTFCFEGPIFKNKILFSIGERVYKPLTITADSVSHSSTTTKGFWFCDLISTYAN
ncbi:MAG: diphthine--ammonia ligase [Cyclobacteriaceae bacterium]|nr:diphthine--ammonia ligase [Cyclobacteriaceae bacterium]